MPVYTRTGDRGETGLLGGKRVPKDDARIEMVGSLDELNATIGIVLVYYKGKREEQLKEVQRKLFAIGAGLGTANLEAAAKQMEKEMDAMENALPPLRNFILPGGSEAAGRLHWARTVCRRAERRVVTLSRKEMIDPLVIVYLNRLSDWLFMLAREENARASVKEEEWLGKT